MTGHPLPVILPTPFVALQLEPTPDQEWNQRCASVTADGRPGLFAGWPAMAPAILEFTAPG